MSGHWTDRNKPERSMYYRRRVRAFVKAHRLTRAYAGRVWRVPSLGDWRWAHFLAFNLMAAAVARKDRA